MSWLNRDINKEKFQFDRNKLKVCKVGQILNPKTYRCISDDSALAKKIINSDDYYTMMNEIELLFDPVSQKYWKERKPSYDGNQREGISKINRVLRGHLVRKKMPGYVAPTLTKRKNTIEPKQVPKNKCKENQIINPKTGRCVKKDGAIGKSLDRKSVV